MTLKDFEDLLRLHKKFCKQASQTQNMDSNSFTDFIGWIQATPSEELNKQ